MYSSTNYKKEGHVNFSGTVEAKKKVSFWIFRFFDFTILGPPYTKKKGGKKSTFSYRVEAFQSRAKKLGFFKSRLFAYRAGLICACPSFLLVGNNNIPYSCFKHY